ncbi:MAG TPA: DUF3108 domain-containing protein [Fibrobacteria bacterium]|nr:DUF3108 domain-containing protein [Fibrobacteria bacterium]HOX51606.1 DUF3108 domain-containing protein [Fibrobacteria bacterium]
MNGSWRRLCLFLGLCAGTVASAAHPLQGERLNYDVAWAGMVVGRASIECIPTNNPLLAVIRTTARANETIQSMYPVLDTIQSFVHISTGLPVQFRKSQKEGNYSAEIRINFQRSKDRAVVSGQIKGVAKPDTAVTLEGGEHDLLSSLVKVRLSPLVPGTSQFLSMVDNRKRFASVEVQCLRRDTIEWGKSRTPTVVVVPKIHGDALFASKGSLTIWMTDDSLHVPLRMESKIALGTIKAELTQRTVR